MNQLLIKLLKFIVRRVARYHRFIDPVDLLARLARFGQPSEVAVPTELLRAGAKMHARGLLNSQAIQYNLDWVWPYWVDRQFDPADRSFIPRAFSLTHINLTHRNWTCVGQPDGGELPIVDPRGLVTPFYDSWSLDFWILHDDDPDLLLSEAERVNQRFEPLGDPVVTTRLDSEDYQLDTQVRVPSRNDSPGSLCRIGLQARSPSSGWLVTSLRPYNPEGISTINSVSLKSDQPGLEVEDQGRTAEVLFEPEPTRYALSNFNSGDVYNRFPDDSSSDTEECSLGMVTAAAAHKLTPGETTEVEVDIPLNPAGGGETSSPNRRQWKSLSVNRCTLDIPNETYEYLFQSSLKTLQLLSGEKIFPGPFTYKRFWYRDAAFMLNALLVTGYTSRVEKVIDYFPEEQNHSGYFCSQKGEWDSNGEVLWIVGKFCDYTDRVLPRSWRSPVYEGAEWIQNKRTDRNLDEPHAGLLPAGFSAEHFGPNDYYYWDNFWGIAGLRKAADLLEDLGDVERVEEFRLEASDLLTAVDESMEPRLEAGSDRAMPPSPYRSVDAGSIGSIAAGYPHDIYPPSDRRLIDTVNALMDSCFHQGTFFQEMIHSGRNPYLSLHLAQVLMKASDGRFHRIVEAVAELASDTGKWPEAVHPSSGGGCMGDGEHGWAAAEWVLMMRNMFVRESGNGLLVGQGLPEDWFDQPNGIEFGPTLTEYGELSLKFDPGEKGVQVEISADWHDEPPTVTVDIPGYESEKITSATGTTKHQVRRKRT
ncbi:MAG: hypothetical protein ABEK50_15900 [bacterium]